MATHKATRTRPYLATGAALASAAAIVAASPALVPSQSLAIGGAPSPTKLVTANYELASLSEITVQGISDAYFFGWGGYVGSGYPNTPDPYYPEVHGVYVAGLSGVSYYLIDNILDTFTDFNLDNYYYEIGWLNGGNPNANYSGLGAVIYVGTNEVFGSDSPISQLTKTVFYYGTYPTIVGSVVSILQSVVPTFDLGPLEVGGGILATLYFYGATPDGTFNYGTPGLSAILAYVSTAITGLFPTAAATAAPAAALVSATDAAAEASTDGAPAAAKIASETKKDGGVAGFKSNSGSATATATETNGSESESAASTGGDAVAAAAEDATETAGTEAANTATDTTSADSTASSSDKASVDANAAAAGSSEAGATAGSSTTGKGGHAAKRPNPVSQIAGKIRSALGGGKSGSDRSSSSASSSSGSSTSSGDN